MTVEASGTPEALALEAARGATSLQATPYASFGVIVGGTPSGDVVVLSHRAHAKLRAGKLVQAFIIAGLAGRPRTIVLGPGRALRLRHGIYEIA